MASLTIEDVKRRIFERHGDIVTIDESTWVNTKHKARFIHKEIGEFWTTPVLVFKGSQGHAYRFKHRVERIAFINQTLKDRFGDLVTLDETTFTCFCAKARFVDKEYGEWFTLPAIALNSYGHPFRGHQKTNETRMISLEETKRRIKQKHGDDITLDENTFVCFSRKAKFIDVKYGPWWATPKNIAAGMHHPKRKGELISASLTLDVSNIVERIRNIHNDQLVLDENTYVNTNIKARFIDNEYGEWWTIPARVICGASHPARIQEKSIITCQKHYGVDNIAQSDTFKEQQRQKNLQKYGVDHQFKSPIVREKIKQTLLARYGVDHPAKNSDIFDKIISKSHLSTEFVHWQTGKRIYSTGSYEKAYLIFMNEKKIAFDWQVRFKIPNDVPIIGGTSYYVDAYEPVRDLYIEIKGYWRDESSKLKWEWFHITRPNSVVWFKTDLQNEGIL